MAALSKRRVPLQKEQNSFTLKQDIYKAYNDAVAALQKFNANKTYVEKLLVGYPIEWVSIPYHKNPPVLSSMYDYRAMKSKAQQLHQKNNFDMVHTRPGLPTLVALWMKKKYINYTIAKQG